MLLSWKLGIILLLMLQKYSLLIPVINSTHLPRKLAHNRFTTWCLLVHAEPLTLQMMLSHCYGNHEGDGPNDTD